MRSKYLYQIFLIFFVALAILFSGATTSTALSEQKESSIQATNTLNVIILVKASQESNELVNSFEDNPKTKLQVTQNAVTEVFTRDDIPSNINIGVMAYGHKLAKDFDVSCSAENVEELLPIQAVSQTANLGRFNSISGVGNSPTTIAIEEAAKKLSESTTGNPLNAILLIADGADDCYSYLKNNKPDLGYQRPEIAAQNLSQNVVIYTIGLNVTDTENAELLSIANMTNGKHYQTDKFLTATSVITSDLVRKIVEFINDFETLALTINPTGTTNFPEVTVSPNATETERGNITESPTVTNIPVPTNTPLIVDVPSQTPTLKGLLVVAIIGLVVILVFGYVYWSSRLRNTSSKTSEESNNINIPTNNESKPGNLTTKVAKLENMNVSDIDLGVFLQDAYNAYSSFGNGGRYISLELLKHKLSSSYVESRFDQLLIMARQKYPEKIWIDKDAKGKIIVKIVK